MEGSEAKYRYRAAHDPAFPEALCAKPDYDPDLWFTEGLEGYAKKVCWVCPELAPCADWGTSEGAPKDGVLGGISGRNRDRIRRMKARGWA